MSIDVAPGNWIDGWAFDGTSVSFPIASLPELSAAEAHPVTGDMRKVLFALSEHLNDIFTAMTTDEKPTKLLFRKSLSSGSGSLRSNYFLSFLTDILAQEVEDEPTGES